MSIFVNLQSIKHTLTNRAETPKFILDQNTIDVKQIAISVEYIAKPATEACCTNQSDWVITKDVYSIAVQAENDRILSSSFQQQEERRTFYKENKFKSFLHKTPIDVLFSESKSEDQETHNKLARLPLYSSQCKINILVYAIQNQNDKFGLEGSRILLQPQSRIQLGRDQLMEVIRDLKSKMMQSSRLSYSRFQRPNQIELVRKFDNYEIIVKKIVKNEENFYESRNSLINKQSYQNYLCNLQQQIKINRRFHLIQFCFVLSVQKFQECAGYLRAGFAKKVNFGESNVRFSYNNNQKPASERLNNVSQYSIEDRKQRNFNFNLDFSGINTKAHSRATQKLQKTRKKKQIQKPAQKQRNSFFDWLCCNSSKNVNNDGEVEVNNSEQVLSMNSNQFQQEQANRLASLKRVDLYLGPCKTNNLFSVLDKGSHSRNFSMIEKHY